LRRPWDAANTSTVPQGDFPLAWERLLWSGRPGWLDRARRFGECYHLTDFRAVVRRGDRTIAELALHDLSAIDLQQTRLQRLRGTSTVVLHPKGGGETIEFADTRQGPQLALILELLATHPAGFELNAALVDDTLGPGAPELFERRRSWIAILVAFLAVAALSAIMTARHRPAPPIVYPTDDAIYPGGQKRSRAEIVAFMKNEVMPFAQRALGPIVGGSANVTCFTCHGQDAEARNWLMPAVNALPEPNFRQGGMERHSSSVDAQMRNAVYGYLAEDTKQHSAAYMRGVVMPGMARLLHRPPYDFTQTYSYNRTRFAFGCYHCHLVSATAPTGSAVVQTARPVTH
ncbi:MAG TPA: PH domain-containing protein, partial [Longimicrobiales bacterium]|nr:PH domain-containing protein [Longimicrobiales bacterium]